jgi:glycosyltransferase involved in cell wall biosynthesis
MSSKISIIMAAKDSAEYLPACLDSIIAQTYTNWELIAVNDHSADNTPAIMQDYSNQDSRIKVINSDREKLIPALKEGYKYCTGTLINRMDSDDLMPDYKLKVLMDEWLLHGKGTVVAGGTRHFVDNGEVGEGFKRYDDWLNNIAENNLHYQEIYKECVIPSHCWLIHKEDFDKVGGFEPEIYPEDYDLCFRFYKHQLKIEGINKVLHHWRDHPIRISRTWDCYKDNRYFDLKLKYFLSLDRDRERPLVLWGAGRNGKDMAKLLIKNGVVFHWVCDNNNKIGHNIYGATIQHHDEVSDLNDPQIIIVISSDDDKKSISLLLKQWHLKPVINYWFFL